MFDKIKAKMARERELLRIRDETFARETKMKQERIRKLLEAQQKRKES